MTQVTLATIRRLNISQARGLVSLRLPPVNWITIGLNRYKSSRTTRVDKLQLRILNKTCTVDKRSQRLARFWRGLHPRRTPHGVARAYPRAVEWLISHCLVPRQACVPSLFSIASSLLADICASDLLHLLRAQTTDYHRATSHMHASS
jgi:hypothetical protein